MDNNEKNYTVRFEPVKAEKKSTEEIIREVYRALDYKGYDPKNQIIGYILSGDPTYVTSYNNARNLIRQIDRDNLLEEILNVYLKEIGI
ncbi:MAG: IreB family regulatory phosphoprotein [Finegoldia sp.]|nr:IreB family regulatory phosphoprotein [Finegoldia sp.]